jgi:MFS family permease
MTGMSARRASVATFLNFVANGFVITGWTARIPGVARELRIDNAQLGTLLLCLAIGSIVSMSQAPRILPSIGAAQTARVGSSTALVGLILMSVAVTVHSPALAAVGLFVAGVGMGLWDVSMNVHGAAVEHALGRTVMPRYHAGFSLGTVGGALVGALLAWADVPIPWGVTGSGILCVILVFMTVPHFLDSRAEEQAAAQEAADAHAAAGTTANRVTSPWREPRTLLIGVVVLACSLTEGSAMDWVAKGAADSLHVTESIAALVFAVFVTAMTLTRWFGTGLVDRFGRVASLRACLAMALIGLLVYVVAPNVWVMAVGVFFWGVGAALGFPLGISAASDDPTKAAARVSVVSVIAYGAFFAGPPILGWLGNHWGIREALSVIALPVAAAILLAGVTRPAAPSPHR